MSVATNNDRLARRSGVVLYSAQTTWGTAVTPATAVGAAIVSHTKVSNNQDIYGPGSPNRRAVVGGSTVCNWEIQYPAFQTGAKTLLQKGFRSNGILPLVTLGFGYEDDVTPTSNKSADQIQDCKIGSVSLSLDASGGHGPISVTLSGSGGLITALTTLQKNSLTTTPWSSYEAVFTKGGSAYSIVSFNCEVNHNLSTDYVIPGAAPTNLRGPLSFTEHNETISGSLSLRYRSGVSVQADCISTFAMQVVFTNTCDATTLTLAFADASFDNERLEIGEDGLMWSVDWTAKTITVS